MERSPDSEGSLLDSDEALERSREVLGSPLHEKSTLFHANYYTTISRDLVSDSGKERKKNKGRNVYRFLSLFFRAEATLLQSTDRTVRRDGILGRGLERNADR